MQPGISALVIFHGIKRQHERESLLLVSSFYTAALAFVIAQEKRNTDCKVKSIEDSKSLWSVDRGMTAMLLRRHWSPVYLDSIY